MSFRYRYRRKTSFFNRAPIDFRVRDGNGRSTSRPSDLSALFPLRQPTAISICPATTAATHLRFPGVRFATATTRNCADHPRICNGVERGTCGDDAVDSDSSDTVAVRLVDATATPTAVAGFVFSLLRDGGDTVESLQPRFYDDDGNDAAGSTCHSADRELFVAVVADARRNRQRSSRFADRRIGDTERQMQRRGRNVCVCAVQQTK